METINTNMVGLIPKAVKCESRNRDLEQEGGLNLVSATIDLNAPCARVGGIARCTGDEPLHLTQPPHLHIFNHDIQGQSNECDSVGCSLQDNFEFMQDTSLSEPTTIDETSSGLVFTSSLLNFNSSDGPWLLPRRKVSIHTLNRSKLPRISYLYHHADGRVERFNSLSGVVDNGTRQQANGGSCAFIDGSHGEETETDDLDNPNAKNKRRHKEANTSRFRSNRADHAPFQQPESASSSSRHKEELDDCFPQFNGDEDTSDLGGSSSFTQVEPAVEVKTWGSYSDYFTPFYEIRRGDPREYFGSMMPTWVPDRVPLVYMNRTPTVKEVLESIKRNYKLLILVALVYGSKWFISSLVSTRNRDRDLYRYGIMVAGFLCYMSTMLYGDAPSLEGVTSLGSVVSTPLTNTFYDSAGYLSEETGMVYVDLIPKILERHAGVLIDSHTVRRLTKFISEELRRQYPEFIIHQGVLANTVSYSACVMHSLHNRTAAAAPRSAAPAKSGWK